MRKRPHDTADDPLDIFEDERFSRALAGATELTAPASVDPGEPPEPPGTPDTSSRIERTLEPDVAPEPRTPRAVAPSREGRARSPRAAQTRPPPEPNVTLRFRVPQTLRSDFQTFKAELAAVLGGVALDDSNLARPLFEQFLVEHKARILEEAAGLRGQLKRPANGDAVGMAEFDHAIGEIFRKARRRRSPGSSSQGQSS